MIMKTIEKIETSQGNFCVVEINSIAEGQYFVETLSSEHYKLSEITEEQLFELTHLTFSMIHFKGIEITPNTYVFKV